MVSASQRERKRAADRELQRNSTIVKDRDGHYCAAAGELSWSCSGPLTVNHRLNRGMGGSTRLNGPEWLVSLCLGHNEQLESDPVFAEVGRESGWKLRKGEDPLKTAIYYRPFAQWRLVDGKGGWVEVTARDEADRANPTSGPLATWRGPKR